MILVKTSELKRFLPHSKNIRSRGILPILSFVKIECKDNRATITKTNLHSFVIFEIEAEFKQDETVLIEENVLEACANFSAGEYITITKKENAVTLDDGFKKLKSQYEDEKHFPSTNIDSEQENSFDEEVISALSLAKNHVLSSSNSVREWKCFVHSVKIGKKSFIVGISGAISYFRSFKQALPEFSLDPETVSIIGRFPDVNYMSGEKYDYFRWNGIVYGFIKAETGRPQLEKVFEQFTSEDSIILPRRDLVNFCEMVNTSLNSSNLPPEVSISDDGNGGIILKYVDVTGIEKASEKIKSRDKTFDVPEIIFQPKNLLTVMKDLDSDDVKISKIFGNMIITTSEEPNYTGTIMELAKL